MRIERVEGLRLRRHSLWVVDGTWLQIERRPGGYRLWTSQPDERDALAAVGVSAGYCDVRTPFRSLAEIRTAVSLWRGEPTRIRLASVDYEVLGTHLFVSRRKNPRGQGWSERPRERSRWSWYIHDPVVPVALEAVGLADPSPTRRDACARIARALESYPEFRITVASPEAG